MDVVVMQCNASHCKGR